MNRHHVTVEVRIEKEKENLQIKYIVKNEEIFPVYITDVYLKRSGSSVELDDHILPMTAEFDRIIFKPRLVKPDRSMTSLAPPSTYARKVAPGGHYEGLFVLPLPLNIVDRSAKVVEQKDLLFKKAVFELGIIPDSSKLSAVPQTIGGKEVFLLNQQAWDWQFVSTTEINNLAIPAVIRNY
jgi:hypothetical protein